MAIKFSPGRGMIVICDFSHNEAPEMIKRRPVIIMSDISMGLCTVVPLSTTAPTPKGSHHYKILDFDTLPAPYDSLTHWVKADMLYTVSYKRLSLPFNGKDASGKRDYIIKRVSDEDMKNIEKCILSALCISP
ncbi:type II toxin-antitoxin system PemK/MazF family toxin [Oxalobacter formigenes]|uniref:type II toxin-antitoxin system PemK/MazF family toxin n=1 Tax=Oxalobacter formigenes TaxID=847 RepID=UPI0022AEA6E7|nr:type II toxin-antitoxin system PemK/MazF family toxin [Oxalobacter formigenes]WAW01199.1 type II toxin-antitoxin system PemK/MazF family toxin [Oxalobacter formigenes]WAW03527.1 type II toxin-antitoxin system PemK/MazF family toxin [Oxalobacter formigenes]